MFIFLQKLRMNFKQELKKVSCIAAPMVAVALLQYLLQVVSIMMVGRLGQLPLSTVAIATSLTNITGFSLLSGLVGGLETLCGQAYGARQYRRVSVYTLSAIMSLALVCVPVTVLWVFLDKLLLLTRQDAQVSRGVKKYSLMLIPSLFGGAISKPLVRLLQTQSLILPMVATSFLVLCAHIFGSWILIFKAELGITGAAIANCISSWLYVALLAFYVQFSDLCKNTRLRLSVDALGAMGQFIRLAVPSAVMVCLKWWSLEIIVLLSGFLPNSRLETSVLSICITISTLHFTLPYGLGAAVSTRVSNELGAGNPNNARLAVWASAFLIVIEAAVVTVAMFLCRNLLGYAYSNDKDVVRYISVLAPFICISIITDSLQGVISGIARGSGWQHIGAYVNLGAFYLVGIPIALVLGFRLHMKAKGLWIGIVVGSVVQSSVLTVITSFVDWKKQAIKARATMTDPHLSQDDP